MTSTDLKLTGARRHALTVALWAHRNRADGQFRESNQTTPQVDLPVYHEPQQAPTIYWQSLNALVDHELVEVVGRDDRGNRVCLLTKAGLQLAKEATDDA